MSHVREIRRLKMQLEASQSQVAALEEDRRREVGERDARIKQQSLTIDELGDEVTRERLKRVSAQRGLVSYMREHGLGDRIGYDPDQDEAVLKEIAEGKIPPPNDRRMLRELMTEPESGQIQAGGLPDPTAPLATHSRTLS